MLTLETQKRIASLFQNIAENERLVEVVRQVLSEQEEFDPHSLFVKISGNKNYVIRKDITDFLDNFSVRYLPQEMNQLFYNYNGSKEKMNYTNFLKMILPNSSHFLRQLKVELIPHRRKVIEVTYELEWALIRVFEKELQLYRVVEVQKEEIMSRWDYKISAAFRCISQKSNKIHIEHGDLQNFIDLMGYSSTSDDILNILRRCDHDKDGKISQLDLELSLTPFKKYKTALIQQAAQAQQQEKKVSSTSLTNSAVYNQSSAKKKSNPTGSAQKESRNISYQQSSNGFEQQKQAKSRSYSYQNGTQGNGYQYQQNDYQGFTNRSNQILSDEFNNENSTINKTPRRQNSTDKIKQSSSIQRNSGKKSQLPQSSSTDINYQNSSNSIHTPTKMKTISYSNNNYTNPNRGNSISNNSTGTSQGVVGSQTKQNAQNYYKNQISNQNIDSYKGPSSNQTSSKKVNSNQTSDYKGIMNSSSGMKSYQNNNNNFQPLSSNSSKVTSKLNRSQNPKENINNSFLNYKEELKNQIKNEIFGQQISNQKRNNQQQNQVYSQHDSNTSYPDFQQQQLPSSQFSSQAQQPPQKVLLLSNYHQNNNQAKYENSSNKRYGELKQKLVDELNNSLVLSEKNSPTNQIYKKLKENLYSNCKNNHSTINYDSQYEMKKSNQYGKEFKQKLREELSRSSQERRQGNYEDLSSSKYNDPYTNYRHSPSPVRVIKVDVKDIDPLKQASTIQSDKYNYNNNNHSKQMPAQIQTEKKQSVPHPLNNTLKESAYQGYINNNTDEDINAVSRYYPSTEKKKLMQTQILNRESLNGNSEIYQQQKEEKPKNGIASPVRTSYQDNMKDYYLEKNKRFEIEEEIEKKMRQKYNEQQLNSRQSSFSPYKADEMQLRKQSIKEQQIIDQIEIQNEVRNAEIKKIKEIEEKQLRELEQIKQKQFLMEEERLNRLRKEEEIRKKQIEEELLRREKIKKEEEELERMQRLKKERERIREQDEKMQQAIRERMRIDDEIRMKQLKSQKIERDVQQLEQQLSRQTSIERVRQYNQMEDFRRQQEIEIKQRELEKTRQIYEMQIRASAENTQRSPFRQDYVSKNYVDKSSSLHAQNLVIDIPYSEKSPLIQLQPVSLQITTPKQQNDKQNLSQPQSSLRQAQYKQELELAAEQETKQRLAREIEQKRSQLELENQRAREAKLAQEKQKKMQESMEESMLMEKKKQKLILIEEMQKKKLQELEIERFKNEKLKEIEEAENQRILAMERDLSYINIQKVNHFNNSFKPEESPTKAYEVINKQNKSEANMSGTPYKTSALNKSFNNGSNLSSLESHVIKIFKYLIDSSNDIQNIKENLSMRADFTLADAFRLMDVDQKGLIELPQFEIFLQSIDIHSSRESNYFLFNKLCPRTQKFLKKEDVDALFKPISSDHSAILNNRVSLYNPRHPDFSKFTFETKDIVSQLFKQLLNQEQKLEQMKSDFLHSKDFKLDDAYFLLDKEKNGYLSHDELKKVLDSYHLCTVDRDIKNIFSRFDRYQRGKITFEDFRQEILPQSNYN